jgi:error-prone DNA polymerase
LATIVGTELSLDLSAPQTGVPDPEGQHLLLLARDPEGYSRLCRTITTGHLAGGEKGRPVYDLDQIAEEVRGHVVVLTGCRKGFVRTALTYYGPTETAGQLRLLVDLFGEDNVVVELTDHGLLEDTVRNGLLAAMGAELGLRAVATNAVHFAHPSRYKLAGALAAVRARRSMDEIAGWLPASSAAHLRSGVEQTARFARYPGILTRTAVLGRELAFDLRLVAPQLPPFSVPPAHDETSYLRQLTLAGARKRYGPKSANPQAYRQIEHELDIIGKLGFPGYYFLVVWDIVRFCREANIFCQGRGSAANSAVCYALGITNVLSPVQELLIRWHGMPLVLLSCAGRASRRARSSCQLPNC